ncbi:MAG TPA: hypothetical protein DCG28_00005, partial [Lachnospiraceae bacterium]|nr:hypothetical protein [Lachnospiraceae bacterium]
PSPPWGGERLPPRGICPLPIYFYNAKKSYNNNRKGVCVLPSPRWGGAGGEVVKTQKFPSPHKKSTARESDA